MTYLFVLSSLATKEEILYLKRYGQTLLIHPNENLDGPVSSHAEMQIVKVKDSSLIYSKDLNEKTKSELLKVKGLNAIEGETILKKDYPFNIAYNILRTQKRIYHNTDYTDPKVKEYFSKRDYELIHVKQGYSGCTSFFLEDTIVTNDKGIAKKSQEETLYFDGADIKLEGYDRGFIGGCVGYIKELGLFITGKLNQDHPLKKLLIEKDIKLYEMTNFHPRDIGGIQIYKL